MPYPVGTAPSDDLNELIGQLAREIEGIANGTPHDPENPNRYRSYIDFLTESLMRGLLRHDIEMPETIANEISTWKVLALSELAGQTRPEVDQDVWRLMQTIEQAQRAVEPELHLAWIKEENRGLERRALVVLANQQGCRSADAVRRMCRLRDGPQDDLDSVRHALEYLERRGMLTKTRGRSANDNGDIDFFAASHFGRETAARVREDEGRTTEDFRVAFGL